MKERCYLCRTFVPAQYSVITQLALLTGARRGEICALRWSDIDLDAGVISINRTVQNIARRGTVLTVTENGKGRRSEIDTYRITARGGKGIRNYDAAKDKVAAVKIVDDVDDVLLSSQEGIIIRLHANEIPLQSRYGSGVRVMRLGENDKVMVLARTDHDDEAQTEQIDTSDADAEPTAEQLAAMEAADAAAAAEAPEADDKGEE